MDDLPGQLIALAVIMIIKGIVTALSTSYSVLNLKKAKYIAEGNTQLNSILENAQKKINAFSIANSLMAVVMGFILSMSPFQTMTRVFMDIQSDTLLAMWLSAAVIIIVATLVYAAVGILIPKMLANRYPDVIVKKLNIVTVAVCIVFKPISLVMDLLYVLLSKTMKDKPDSEEDVSEEEILLMADMGSEQGTIDEHEMEMISNIFEFDDRTVGEICTHRKDIVALSEDASIDDIVEMLADEKFSRIPVYREDIDHITGILHVKDFIYKILKEGKENFSISSIIMKPYFVPYTKKTDELFSEMQKRKVHIAVVTDEYGGTEGIVTMEDLIEEVMGEIQDEYDVEEEPEIEHIEKDTLRIEGATLIEDVSKELEVDFPEDEYESLGGFLVGMLDKIPDEKDEGVEVEYKGYVFKIEKVEDNRIASVTVRSVEKKEQEKEAV